MNRPRCQQIRTWDDGARCIYPARYVVEWGGDREVLVCGYHRRAYTLARPLNLKEATQ